MQNIGVNIGETKQLLSIQEINQCIAETGISVFEGDIYIFARALEALVREKIDEVDTNQ